MRLLLSRVLKGLLTYRPYSFPAVSVLQTACCHYRTPLLSPISAKLLVLKYISTKRLARKWLLIGWLCRNCPLAYQKSFAGSKCYRLKTVKEDWERDGEALVLYPKKNKMYDRNTVKNRLLKSLPPDIYNQIQTLLEPVTLERGQVLVKADQPIDYIYFLCEGIGSVITVSDKGPMVEAGMFGREGFSPTSAAVGATTSIHEVVMQVSGSGHRIEIGSARAEINRNSLFANLLARYIQTFASQLSYTVWANVNLHIHERLARWLLMSHDRTDGDEIVLTHDFIALMLGVRRPSITTGLHVLEGKKLIISERGRITVRDRKGLEDFAGEAYGKPEEEYRRLFGLSG